MSERADPQILGPSGRAARFLLGILLLAVVGLNVANAAGRYLVGLSFTGIDELMVYLMIWIVMAGAALSLLARTHIAIDLVPASCSPRRLALLHVLHDVVALWACGFAAIASWRFAERIAGLDTTSMGLGVPLVWAHAALVVGFGALALGAGFLLLRDLAALSRPARGRST